MHVNQYMVMALMLVAGGGIPLMAAMSSGLSQKVDSVLLAVTTLSIGAAVLSFSLLLISREAVMVKLPELSVWHLFIGGFFIFYLMSISYSAPRIGLGTAVFLVLLGQLVCAAVIDHWGLFGNPVKSLSIGRFAGLVLILAGFVLTQFMAGESRNQAS